jgi:F-type H+-transporting ATPase subunit b
VIELATLAAANAGGFGQLFSGLGINAWAFISQLVSFGIVFFLLWRWGFPAITGILDKRQAMIREGVENAERAKQELAEATARAEQVLTEARREAQQTIERASKVAQDEARRIEEEARAHAEQISQQQIARIQQEANRARNELSALIVNLSIDAASKVINRSVDSNDNRRLVEDFVAATNKARQQ